MKKLLLFWGFMGGIFLLGSCSGEQTELKEEELQILPEEYFIATIEGEEPFEVLDEENMSAGVSVNPETGVVALGALGILEDKDNTRYIHFYFCFYDGIGTYYTGNDNDISYATIFNDKKNYWLDNDTGMGDPGKIKITKASDHFVEGEFDINFYDYDNMEASPINAQGQFGLILDENELLDTN